MPNGVHSAPVVAISGGSDSLCLAVLAKQYFTHVSAVTVDHKLRPESALESLEVGRILSSIELPHSILTIDWSESQKGSEPVTNVQQAARVERYRLLAEHCRSVGDATLLTGHNINDQAETVVTRVLKDSGVDGLAGIAAEVHLQNPGLHIARPVLSFDK
ncbi:tRNA(Ile)-lysidine synthetase, partial [Sphaeroforma arctica JP610]